MKVFLLYGGKVAEHDISVISAYHIYKKFTMNITKWFPFTLHLKANGVKDDH